MSFSASTSISFPTSSSSATISTTTKSITAADFNVLTSVGDWSFVQNSHGDYTSLFTTTIGAAAQLQFIGTAIQVKGTIPSVAEGRDSPIGLYYVDGVLDTTYHYIRHSDPNYNYTFFQSPTLPAGQHTLLIESDVDGTHFTIDYIDITVANELVDAQPTGLNLYPTNTADWNLLPNMRSSTSWQTTTATPTSSFNYSYNDGYNGYAGRIVLNIIVLIFIILGVLLVLSGIGGLLYYFVYWPQRKKRRDKMWAKYAAAAVVEAGVARGNMHHTIIGPGGVLYAPVPTQSTAHLISNAQPHPTLQLQPQPQAATYTDAPISSSPTSRPQELSQSLPQVSSSVQVPDPSQVPNPQGSLTDPVTDHVRPRDTEGIQEVPRDRDAPGAGPSASR